MTAESGASSTVFPNVEDTVAEILKIFAPFGPVFACVTPVKVRSVFGTQESFKHELQLVGIVTNCKLRSGRRWPLWLSGLEAACLGFSGHSHG